MENIKIKITRTLTQNIAINSDNYPDCNEIEDMISQEVNGLKEDTYSLCEEPDTDEITWEIIQ